MTTKLKVPANKEIEAITLLLSQGDKIENRTIIDNETNILLACNLKEAFDINKYPDYFRLISDYSKYFNWTYPSIGNIPATLFQNNYDCTNFKNTFNNAHTYAGDDELSIQFNELRLTINHSTLGSNNICYGTCSKIPDEWCSMGPY